MLGRVGRDLAGFVRTFGVIAGTPYLNDRLSFPESLHRVFAQSLPLPCS